MQLSIDSKMRSADMNETLIRARQFLDTQRDKINPDIIKILFAVLYYAEKELSPGFSSLTKNESRYPVVNFLFNSGVNSHPSLEAEKKFYADAKRILENIYDKKSKLRDSCLPLVRHGEAALMYDLERSDPAHKNAVNGMISGVLGLGMLLSYSSRNPYYFMLSLLVVVCKCVPCTGEKPSPSLLGYAAYHMDPEVRQWANQVHAGAPVNLGYRLLNIFSKTTNNVLVLTEQAVQRAERMIGMQHPPGLENRDRLMIEDDLHADTSYAARRRLQSR